MKAAPYPIPLPAMPAVLRAIAGLLCLGAALLHAALPSEDDLANRGILDTGVATTANNSGATLQSGEPIPAGYTSTTYQGTLWYEWTPQAIGWHELNTTGSTADTVLSVWTSSTPFNPTLASLTVLHVNHRATDGGHSRVQFLADDSQTYFVAVASPGPSRGALTLTAVPTPDPFSKLTAFSFNAGTVNVTSAAAPVTATFTLQSTSEIAAGEFRLYDPHHTLHTTVPVTGVNRTSGGIPSGTYTVQFTLPRHLEPGTWRWGLYLRNSVTPTVLTKEAGYGWESLSPSLVSATTLTVQNTGSIDTYQVWTSLQGIAASAAPQSGNYTGDGVASLTKFAFGVPLTQSSPGPLIVTGSGGSAILAKTGMSIVQHTGQVLAITYIRRKTAASEGLTYQVQFSDDLIAWTPATLPPTVIASNTDYEAVTVPDVVPTGPQPRRFVQLVINHQVP